MIIKKIRKTQVSRRELVYQQDEYQVTSYQYNKVKQEKKEYYIKIKLQQANGHSNDRKF